MSGTSHRAGEGATAAKCLIRPVSHRQTIGAFSLFFFFIRMERVERGEERGGGGFTLRNDGVGNAQQMASLRRAKKLEIIAHFCWLSVDFNGRFHVRWWHSEISLNTWPRSTWSWPTAPSVSDASGRNCGMELFPFRWNFCRFFGGLRSSPATKSNRKR